MTTYFYLWHSRTQTTLQESRYISTMTSLRIVLLREESWFDSRQGQRFVHVAERPNRLSVTVRWIESGFSLGMKRPERDTTTCSGNTSAGRYTSTSQVFFLEWYLLKLRGSFTFYASHFLGMKGPGRDTKHK